MLMELRTKGSCINDGGTGVGFLKRRHQRDKERVSVKVSFQALSIPKTGNHFPENSERCRFSRKASTFRAGKWKGKSEKKRHFHWNDLNPLLKKIQTKRAVFVQTFQHCWCIGTSKTCRRKSIRCGWSIRGPEHNIVRVRKIHSPIFQRSCWSLLW